MKSMTDARPVAGLGILFQGRASPRPVAARLRPRTVPCGASSQRPCSALTKQGCKTGGRIEARPAQPVDRPVAPHRAQRSCSRRSGRSLRFAMPQIHQHVQCRTPDPAPGRPHQLAGGSARSFPATPSSSLYWRSTAIPRRIRIGSTMRRAAGSAWAASAHSGRSQDLRAATFFLWRLTGCPLPNDSFRDA